jgi:N-acetylmuramoyl-L-alanine amidase
MIAGCEESMSGSGLEPVTERQTVSISQLAGYLGMRISERTGTHVTLRDSSNTVMLFTYSGGKVYVNGKPVGRVGTVSRFQGQSHVSRSLINQIRPAMRASFVPRIKIQPRKSTGCVVIDAGHGGKDPGATSVLGYQEKGVNLAVATKVASLLKRSGIKAVLTRRSDRFIELEDRAAISNRYDPDLFISIHADSNGDGSRRGFTLFVARSASWSSRRAASAISKSMRKTGLTDQGTRRADYRVLVKTDNPAVLIELGYLSNPSEARLLRTGSFQTRLAKAIANGISDFLGRAAL